MTLSKVLTMVFIHGSGPVTSKPIPEFYRHFFNKSSVFKSFPLETLINIDPFHFVKEAISKKVSSFRGQRCCRQLYHTSK